MKYQSTNGIYHIEIPNAFFHAEEEDILSIYKKNDGVGSISVTSYHVPAHYEFVIKNELFDYLKCIERPVVWNDMNLKKCTGEYCIYEFTGSRGRHWRVWVCYKNFSCAFISYSCKKRDRHTETNEVNDIVNSFQFIG